ncbi:MAG: hypothetical protein EPN39_06785 [Chitinophagaceae bacterium]|jgi:hypothetical protein|nr:MAG: hypothetical protein EPN39_06785 [Chitinophagaceae bacterium]
MSFLLILHSWLRWAVIITAIWTIIRAIIGLSGHKAYSSGDNKSSLLFMISMDLQFLIGILLYFIGGWAKNWTDGQIGEVMQNSAQRFFTVEHITMMVIAWIIVHIGRSVVKKAKTDKIKHSKSLVYFLVAFILIMIAIPWPFRTGLGFHPLFRF